MKVLVPAIDIIKLERGDKKRKILLNGCNTYIERGHGSDYLYSKEVMGEIDHDNY